MTCRNHIVAYAFMLPSHFPYGYLNGTPNRSLLITNLALSHLPRPVDYICFISLLLE